MTDHEARGQSADTGPPRRTEQAALLLVALLVTGCQPTHPNVCEEIAATKLLSKLTNIRDRARTAIGAKDFKAANSLLLEGLQPAIAAQDKIPNEPGTVVIDDRGLLLGHASFQEETGMPDDAARERLGTFESYIEDIQTACPTPGSKAR
jgi:hypothetical protein